MDEVNAAYEAHEFPELQTTESQMAMIKAVERISGKSAVVNQVLTEECATATAENKDAPVVDLKDIGFKVRRDHISLFFCIGETHIRVELNVNLQFQALMTTLSSETYKTEEVVTNFQPEDFAPSSVNEKYADLVDMTRKMSTAHAADISVTEIQSAMIPAEETTKAEQPETMETQQVSVADEPSSEISPPAVVLDIKEGDTFFALATFVSETGEAMNLVEGEKVHVLEWNNADWWYVRKHLTEESGWVPAQYLKDEQTYTLYVQKKLVEKIEKLPVFDSESSFYFLQDITVVIIPSLLIFQSQRAEKRLSRPRSLTRSSPSLRRTVPRWSSSAKSKEIPGPRSPGSDRRPSSSPARTSRSTTTTATKPPWSSRKCSLRTRGRLPAWPRTVRVSHHLLPSSW